LARLAVDALVLDDLQIFGAPGALVTEEHGGLGSTHHGLPPSVLVYQRPILWHYVNAKFQTCPSKINRLPAADRR
jgi:hypothetical protein